MSLPAPLLYAAALAVAAVLSLYLTPTVLRVAVKRGVLDEPGGHKRHTTPTPYLGGIAIIVAFAVAVLLGALIVPPQGQFQQFVVIVLAGLGLAVIGLLDDLRGLGPATRIVFEVAAATALVAFGAGVALFDGSLLNWLFTALWVVGITNAFNLLDNMDGLSAGVATIAATSFFAIAAANGQFLVATLAIALAGCAIGFLRHNFHPARIYMGDAGSLFLGFMLAAVGLKLRFEGPTHVTFVVPIVVLGVAITDTALVMAVRILHRRNPFSGGRDHISHRLVFLGIPVPYTVGLIYGAAVVHGFLGLVISRIDVTSAYMLMGLVIAVNLAFAVALALVPVYETSQRRRYMVQEVRRHEDTDELRRVSA